MVEPRAQIRPLESSDHKDVLFLIGKSNMESLAVANRQAYSHPLILSVWIAASCIMVQLMHWWPNPDVLGYLSYLSPVPAFACMAVPLMFLMDWINRPYFEKLTHEALRRPDIRDLKAYYSRSPSSGFWILEYGVRFVGIIALDASPDSTWDGPSTLTTTKRNASVKKSSPTAIIRHFFVEEEYRSSEIQTDLLSYAVRHAFTSDDTIQQIKASDSPLASYARQTLRSSGFQLEDHTDKVGVFGWKLGVRVLERAEWEKRKA